MLQAASRESQQGFTLIELMFVIAVLAVLLTIAAPNFNNLLLRWRIMQTAELFQSTLYLARSEALKRGGHVVVEKVSCPGTNDSDWNCGWRVCHSMSDSCDSSDALAIQHHEPPENLDIVFRNPSQKKFAFNRYGRLHGSRGIGISISPKDQGDNHEAARGVCMASGGRIRIIPQEEIPCKD